MRDELFKTFKEIFKKEPTDYEEAGGRFELLGNHTDHNHGCTLAATCSLTIKGAFRKEDDNLVRFFSKGNCDFIISLDTTNVIEEEIGKPECFVRGVANYLKNQGYEVGGFTAYVESSVPPGAGVSSSAAFEILIGKIFNRLYNADQIRLLELCKAGQYAENNYFGKKSGLLDQIACACNGVSYIDFENIENPEVEILHEGFEGYQFVIVDTGKSHAELSDLYSSITSDMWNAAKKMGHNYLRECSPDQLEANKDLFTEGEYNRAKHFFDENERAKKGQNFVKNGDYAGFLQCMRESEASSRNLLKNAMVNDVYDGSLAEAIDISNQAMDNAGASKINGGGFGGSIICVVPKTKLDKYLSVMIDTYGRQHVFCVSIFN